jgi:xanthine dehydrogenase YagT iron-sulfur-binding subunit
VRRDGSTATVSVAVNGTRHTRTIDTRMSLLDLLREELGLTGSKKGCDHGQCGACTVLLDGIRVNACLVLAVTCDGGDVTTVEGLARDRDGARLQQLFVEHDAFQCGYCTPGQLCSATALLRESRAGVPSAVGDTELTAEEIRERMSGNLCRCGAYVNIVTAIGVAAE